MTRSDSNWESLVINKIHHFDECPSELNNFLCTVLIDCGKLNGNDYKELSIQLLRAGTMTSVPDEKMFSCIISLVHAGKITWPMFLHTVTRFSKYRRTKNTEKILNLLSSEINSIQCKHSDQKSYEELMTSVFELFAWLTDCIYQLLKLDDEEFHGTLRIAIRTTSIYVNDKFFSSVLQLGIIKQADFYESAVLSTFTKIFQCASVNEFQRELREIEKQFKKLSSPMTFKANDLILSLCKMHNRAGIRTLTAVYISIRTLTPVHEMAEVLMNFGTIFAYEKDAVIFDVLHAALFILNDEIKRRNSVRALLYHFMFAKIPIAFKCFIDKKYLIYADIYKGMLSFIHRFSEELSELDTHLRESTISVLLVEMLADGAIDKENSEKLNAERQTQIMSHGDLHHSLIYRKEEQKPVALLLKWRDAKTSIEKTWNNLSKLELILPRLVGSCGFLIDSLCSIYTMKGNICDLTRRFASICRESESIQFQVDKGGSPNVAFLLLMRILTIFPYLNLKDIVCANDKSAEVNISGVFYQWSSQFVMRVKPPVDPAHEEPAKDMGNFGVTNEMKHNFRDNIVRAEYRDARFWNTNEMTFRRAIEMVPLLGTVWLEEFRDRRNDPAISVEFKYFIRSLEKTCSMIVCLSQWLEGQEVTEHRKVMAQFLLEGIEELVPPDGEEKDKSIWPIIKTVCRQYLDDIRTTIQPHPVSITLKSIAMRSFPESTRLQVPDSNMLKDCWIYGQRQNWFNHKPLALIERCNQAEQHRMWIRLFINNLMRLMAQDIMSKCLEFISAILHLDPINSILIMLEVLFEYLLQMSTPSEEDKKEPNEEANTTAGSPGIQHEAPHILPLIKLTVQVLLQGIWLVDHVKGKSAGEPSQKKPKLDNSSEDSSSPQYASKDVDLLLKTIRTCIQYMSKEALQGLYTPGMSAVIHMVKSIATSPPSRPRDMLITFIPVDMLHRMGSIDPNSISLEMFCEFCDPRNEEHHMKKIRFLCMLRSAGAFDLI